jgi:hypothetical protein
MIDKITIPPVGPWGYCAHCPFLETSGNYSHCTIRMEKDINGYADASPGPECIPGDYAVLPVDELAALRADSERLGEILTERMNASASTSPTGSEIAALRAEVERLREALHSITECNGAFSRDQLTHAENTIEAMRKTAVAALVGAEKPE